MSVLYFFGIILETSIDMSSINIIHLVSGEQVIAKVSELRDNEGEPFCFLLSMPMVLDLVPGEKEPQREINFFPWSPFSSSREFRIGFEKIISIGDPLPNVFKTFVELTQPVYPVLSPEEFEKFKQAQGATKK